MIIIETETEIIEECFRSNCKFKCDICEERLSGRHLVVISKKIIDRDDYLICKPCYSEDGYTLWKLSR